MSEQINKYSKYYSDFLGISNSKRSNHNKPNRVLILQGGGALGAYEVGVLKFLSKELQKEDKKNNFKNRPLFDVIIGSSMGAVNAAILIHNVTHPKYKNQNSQKTWNDAIENLYNFYIEISNPLSSHPLWWIERFYLESLYFKQFWTTAALMRKIFSHTNTVGHKFWQDNKDKANFVYSIKKNFMSGDHDGFSLLEYSNFLKNGIEISIPSPENARKYYYYLNSVLYGIPKVLSPAIIQPDFSFFDPFWSTHIYTRFSNEPLVKTMKKFWDYKKFPIRTTEEEPRLLVVAVDIEDSSNPVIIDSYKKENEEDSCFSEYGNSMQYRLEYKNGITEDHIRASMSTPLRHEYPKFEVYNTKTKQYESRYFWDGAILANSPIREVIKSHVRYWQEQKNKEQPDLELYVINLYPTVKKGIPNEPYSIQDRETDMRFQDRTSLNDIVSETNLISFMEDAIEDLKQSSQQTDLEDLKFSHKKKLKIFETMDNKIRYKTPKILKFIKIERQEKVENSVFGKAFDFSRKTIEMLIEDGYKDAKKTIEQNKKRS